MHAGQDRTSHGGLLYCSWTFLECFGTYIQALKLKTVDNDTVLTEAIESMDLAMVKQVLECVQTNSSGPQQVGEERKNPYCFMSWRNDVF